MAKLILPGDDVRAPSVIGVADPGFIVTTLIGIAGVLIGFIASAVDTGDLDEFFDIAARLIATAAGLLLLVIDRVVTGGTSARGRAPSLSPPSLRIGPKEITDRRVCPSVADEIDTRGAERGPTGCERGA